MSLEATELGQPARAVHVLRVAFAAAVVVAAAVVLIVAVLGQESVGGLSGSRPVATHR